MTSKQSGLYRHRALVNRNAHDYLAALSSYRRLFEFSRKSGNSAMAIFAVYKALQRLEVDQTHIAPGAAGHNSGSELSVPRWVYDGVWLALNSYLLNPQQGGMTAGKRRTR